MNLKRAILLSIVAYIVSFILGILTGLLFGMDFSTAQSAPTEVWIVGLIGIIIIGIFFSLWYFNKAQPGLKEGFYLGIIFIIVSFIIELILVVPYILLSNSSASIVEYYTNPLFWLSLILLIATTTLVGKYRKKK